MKIVVCIAVATLVVMSSQTVLAFSASECNGVVQKLDTFSSASQEDAVRFALSLDQDSWSKLQQNSNSGLKVLFDDVSVGANSDWNKAKEAQDKMKLKYNLDQSHGSRGLWTSQRIDQAAYVAYRDCLLSAATGMHVILQKIEGASIRGTWIFGTAAADPTIRSVRVFTSGNAKAATDSPLVWSGMIGSAKNDFVIARTGTGNIDVTVELTSGDGNSKRTDTVALDPIPEPQALQVAIVAMDDLRNESEFNAFYTSDNGVVKLPLTPRHPSGQIISATSQVTRYETTAITDLLQKVEGPLTSGLPSNSTIYVPVGCAGAHKAANGRDANCSGHGVVTGVERYVTGWRPYP